MNWWGLITAVVIIGIPVVITAYEMGQRSMRSARDIAADSFVESMKEARRRR